MRVTILGMALASLLPLGACDVRPPYPDPGEGGALILRAVNESPNEVDIYAVHGTHRQRIVHLCAFGRADVEVGEPWASWGEITIFADAVSSEGTFMSPAIEVVGDTYIALTIRGDIGSSTYVVRYQQDAAEIENRDERVP